MHCGALSEIVLPHSGQLISAKVITSFNIILHHKTAVNLTSLQNLGIIKKVLDVIASADVNTKIEDMIPIAVKAMHSLGLSIEEMRNILQYTSLDINKAEDAISLLSTTGTKGISKLKDAFKGLWALIAANWQILATIAAVAATIAVLDWAIVNPSEAYENMNKSFEEFEAAQQKVSDLNSELETTKDRINELEAKDGLTFVEQSELEKLRESVRLLEIQADLAEKEAVREGKEAAEDAVESYNKNFVEISKDKTDQYAQGLANGEYSVEDLAMNEANVSANIAALKSYKKALENIEDEDFFLDINERAENLEDTIWEQVD